MFEYYSETFPRVPNAPTRNQPPWQRKVLSTHLSLSEQNLFTPGRLVSAPHDLRSVPVTSIGPPCVCQRQESAERVLVCSKLILGTTAVAPLPYPLRRVAPPPSLPFRPRSHSRVAKVRPWPVSLQRLEVSRLIDPCAQGGCGVVAYARRVGDLAKDAQRARSCLFSAGFLYTSQQTNSVDVRSARVRLVCVSRAMRLQPFPALMLYERGMGISFQLLVESLDEN